ncbi:FadR/GntR family transcriptional regulator [Nocardioides aquiterrae]|uniref:FadR/GntR family transcriptional regulator n=1 Tax=Nocardioides aquiterrae TaxID=203799 RepID=A0ABN1U993_9ACTN
MMSGEAPTAIVPVRQLRLSDAVAAQLEALINSGHFGADGRLPSERELAERFAVGRGSMREAIRKLEALGIITRAHGVGTFGVAGAASARMGLLTAGDVSALELFEVRYRLEPLAAELSAERRTSADLKRLKEILDHSLRPDLSDEDFVRLDFEFHSLVVHAAKNSLLAQMYQQLEPHHAIYSAKVISLPERRSRAQEGHHRILAAVSQRNTAEAREQALAHLLEAEGDLVSAVEKSESPHNR